MEQKTKYLIQLNQERSQAALLASTREKICIRNLLWQYDILLK